MSEDEYTRLLNQFPEKLHAAMNWKTYLNRLVQVGRRTGRTDVEIGDDIKRTLRGQLDDRTIRLYLPPSMKHEEKIRNLRQRFPQIPPQPIIEVEPERPRPIESGIVKIIFDPAPIDRDRTQVFIIHYDLSTNTIKKYETVGRRSIK